jgi:drug/metabolite transporter (DMT)-like permease
MSSQDLVSPHSLPGPIEYALLAALAAAWGTSFMFTKIAVSAFPPVTLVAVRMVFGALVMLSFLRLRGPFPRISRRDLKLFAVIGLISNALPLTMITISVSFVDSSVTATTMALVPLITMMMAMAGGTYPTLHNTIGLLVGLAGIAVLFGPKSLMSVGNGSFGALCGHLVFFIVISDGARATIPAVGGRNLCPDCSSVLVSADGSGNRWNAHWRAG